MIRYLLFITLTVWLLSSSDSWGQSSKAAIKEYRQIKEKALVNFTPFDMERRFEMYQLMDQLPRFLMEKLQPNLIANQECLLHGQVYWIAYNDFDKDKIPDQFVLQTQEKKILPQDLGFLFDLNGDGETDYIIYNGGSMITDDIPFYHYFYHWIDTDYNGRVDAVAYNHVIYSEGSRPNPNRIFWIMDRNGDGAPDYVDFTDNKNKEAHIIEEIEGKWQYATLFGLKTVDSGDKMYFSLFDQYMQAVRVLNKN